MSDIIHWVIALKIKDGAYGDFETLMKEMVDATKADEPGALAYEWYVSADKSTCHIYERYADNDAVVTHMGNFGAKFGERFLAALEPTGLNVYGNCNDKVRGILDPLGAVYRSEVGGFAR